MSKEFEKVTSNINIEGAELIFRNFAGRGSDYNDEGNRNFGVLLDDDLAEDLIHDGWNVKHLKPREDDPDQHEQAWLPVKVKFDPYPPIINMITSSGKYRIEDDDAWQLDECIIKECDLVIRPYNYPAIKGRPAGVSAYLKTAYIVIEEDDFAKKYSDIPDIRR